MRKDRDYERANEPLNLFFCTSKGSINLASIITPNIFVLSTNGIEESPNDRLRILLFKNKGLDLTVIKLKRIACVFGQLITILLFKSQVEIFIKSKLNDSSKPLISLDESEAVESSPKRSRKDFRSK